MGSCRTGLLALGLLLWLLACSGCAALEDWQRQKIYRPTPGTSADFPGLRAGDERYFVDVPAPGPAQRIELWWLPQTQADAPTLLYLHGTFRNLSDNLHKINALRDAGFAVLALDYRGWGQSSPITPSEQSIVQDAGIAWSELKRREPRPAQRVLYGHSMGSGVAVELASHLRSPADYGGLILESAFTSFADVADQASVLASVLVHLGNERFNSIDKMIKVRAPLLMIHGGHDSTIPIRLGRQLFDAANAPKQWLDIENGDHSDLDLVAPERYRAALRAFQRRYLSAP